MRGVEPGDVVKTSLVPRPSLVSCIYILTIEPKGSKVKIYILCVEGFKGQNIYARVGKGTRLA